MRNSFRSYGVDDSQLEEIWSVIEAFDKKTPPPPPPPPPTTPAAKAAPSESNGKRKQGEEEEEETEPTSTNGKAKKSKSDNNINNGDVQTKKEEEDEAFDWLEAIKKECLKHTDRQVDFTALQKKVHFRIQWTYTMYIQKQFEMTRLNFFAIL